MSDAHSTEILIQRCTRCGALRNPPAHVCRICSSDASQMVAARGFGRVYSFTQPVLPRKRDGGSHAIVALVELDEGVRIIGLLHEIPLHQVHIGMSVACEREAAPASRVMLAPCSRPR